MMSFVKAALVVAALLPLASYAALGGAPSAGTAGSASLLRSTASANAAASVAPYTVHAAFGSDGVAIHEYVLPSNVVFAVTWQGPVRPDMSALLGSYFMGFANAAEEHVRGTGPLIEDRGDFHVESAGRAGHFFGKAYLPRLVPVSVRVDELQ